MKTAHKIAFVSALVGTIGYAAIHQFVPVKLYPNPTISPGLVATEDITQLTAHNSCGTYSQCHRQTSEALKNQVRKEYPNCPKDSEIDHVVPLSIGGADDLKNLWCQPATNMWNGKNFGFHTKDALESFLAAQVKAGKIAPKDAQSCILQDWVACWQKYMSGKVGGIANDPDNE